MTEPLRSIGTTTTNFAKMETESPTDDDSNHDVQCPICLRCEGEDELDDEDHDMVDKEDDTTTEEKDEVASTGGRDNNKNNNNNRKKKKRKLSFFVYGPCRHKFCLPCLTRVFASSNGSIQNNSNNNNNNNNDTPDAILSIPNQDDLLHLPTMGRCPMCRQTLCLFDLKTDYVGCIDDDGTSSRQVQDDDDCYDEATTSTTTLPSQQQQKQKQQQLEREHGVDGRLLVPTECDISKTELAGFTYVMKGSGVGDLSIHFPAAASPHQQQDQHTSDEGVDSVALASEASTHDTLPYLDVTNVSEHRYLCGRRRPWVYDDGTKVECGKIYFQKESIQYHKESRTFRGTIQWDLVDILDNNDKDEDEDGNASVGRNSGSGGQQEPRSPRQRRQQQQRRDCTKRLQQSSRWEYMMSFSSDFRNVAKGVIIQHRDICCEYPSCTRPHCKFLFDGEWTVSLPSLSSSASIMTTDKQLLVKVHGNDFTICMRQTTTNGDDRLVHMTNFIDCIKYTDPCFEMTTYSASLVWPDPLIEDEQNEQLANSSKESLKSFQLLMFNHRMKGLSAIGDRIEWSKSSSSEEEQNSAGIMVWQRERVTPQSVPLKIVKFGGGRGARCSYHRSDVFQGFPVPLYHPETLWGNVFAQDFTVGLASYHFGPPELEGGGSAYISYEHEVTSVWPNLDDGQPIPSRISFSDTNFDPSTYTFRGKIDWEGVHGTTWNGARWWRYEIIFSRDYSCIGTFVSPQRAFLLSLCENNPCSRCVTLPCLVLSWLTKTLMCAVGGRVYARLRGSMRELVMSTFGDELVYLNVGYVETMKDELEGESWGWDQFTSIQTQMESLGALPEQIAQVQSRFFVAQFSDIDYPSTTS